MLTLEIINEVLRGELYEDKVSVFQRNGRYEYELNNFEQTEFIEITRFLQDILEERDKINVRSKIRLINEFTETVNFSQCIFYDEVFFEHCTFKEDVYIENAIFKKKLSFSKSTFESKVRFHWTHFYETVNFYNTTFEDLVDFYNAEFRATQKFALTDFLGKAIFSNVIFHKQIQFVYNKVKQETMISFENAVFSEGIDISRANFWCKLQFWGAVVNENPKELWLYQFDTIEEVILSSNSIALKRIRESLRIIKNEFRSIGNNIEALEIHKKEMLVYQKELKERKEKKWENLVILWFNKYSNNFGTNWRRSVLFTFTVAFIFYIFFLLSLSNQLEINYTWASFTLTVKTFFQFLNLTTWNFEPFGIKNYNLGYLVLFVGRIFIGYGYYQTIQAFRKYGKN